MKKTRSELRENIMTILYQINVYRSEKMNYDLESILEENKANDDKFIITIVNGVLEKEKDLDKVINKYMQDWTISRLGNIDKAIFRMSVYELLKCIAIASANDACVVIAEAIGGNHEEFVKMMNEKAAAIGCTDTHFVTPNGLDAEDDGGKHSISAADLARIMSYCILESPKAEEFLGITQQKSYSFSNVEGTRNFTCTNHNLFLDMMEGAISGKTGFTGEAGYCYVGALENGGRTFVVALLGCGWPNNKSYKWVDTKKLMQYALKTYQYRDVWKEPALREITVENGIPDDQELFGDAKSTPVLQTEEGKQKELQVLLSESEQVEVTVCQEETMQAPVTKGTEAGYVCYTLNGEVLKKYPLVIEEEIPVKNYAWVFRKICKKYMMIN